MGRGKKSGPRSTEAGARRRPAPSPEVAEPALGGESTPAASLDGEGPAMMASEAAETEAPAEAEAAAEAKAEAAAKAEAEAAAEAKAEAEAAAEAKAKAKAEAEAKADAAKAEAEAKAEARAPLARPPIDGASSDAQGGPPPAASEPLVPRFPYSVAPGRAITSRRGMLGPGEEVRADFFLGGEETLAALVDKGVVLEA